MSESVPETPAAHIPYYEGRQVHATALKVQSVSHLECDGRVLKLDDIVRLTVEGRVSSVNHMVNEKTGELMRVQTVKAIDVSFASWDPADPNDDGVITLRPRSAE
jgi:hypothetical protein